MKSLLFLIFLLCSTPSWAALEFAYTGNVAEKIDGGIGLWFPGSNGGYFGGPIANNSLGNSKQFTVSSLTRIKSLSLNALLSHNDLVEKDISEFDIKLYGGSTVNFILPNLGPIPNYNNLVSTSHLYLENASNQDKQFVNYVVPFDLDLEEGSYWIGPERFFGHTHGDPIIYNMKISYLADENAAGVVVTPEPPTGLLLVVGLLIWTAFSQNRTRVLLSSGLKRCPFKVNKQ